MVGKWDLGLSTAAHNPVSRGFDSFYGHYSSYVQYWNKEHEGFLDLQNGLDLVTPPPPFPPYLLLFLFLLLLMHPYALFLLPSVHYYLQVTNADEISEDLHVGYLYNKKVEQVIEDHATNHADQPMFLYYSIELLHKPWYSHSLRHPHTHPHTRSLSPSHTLTHFLTHPHTLSCTLTHIH